MLQYTSTVIGPVLSEAALACEGSYQVTANLSCLSSENSTSQEISPVLVEGDVHEGGRVLRLGCSRMYFLFFISSKEKFSFPLHEVPPPLPAHLHLCQTQELSRLPGQFAPQQPQPPDFHTAFIPLQVPYLRGAFSGPTLVMPEVKSLRIGIQFSV